MSYSRTPIGSFRGQLNKLTASDLGSVSIKSAIEKAGKPESAMFLIKCSPDEYRYLSISYQE